MEEDILYTAVQGLSEDAKIDLEVSSWYNEAKDKRFDGSLSIEFNSIKYYFFYTIKRKPSLSQLLDLNHSLSTSQNFLLIADYLSKPLKTYLKEQHISYLDSSGNAYITNEQGLYVYIEHNKKPPSFTKKSTNAFSKAGLKVIYQFLIDENILNEPYRTIGGLAKVSIDTVRRVIKALFKDGYLIKIDAHQIQLQHKKRLFQEWVTLFNKVLRPQLKQQRFKSKDFAALSSLELAPLALAGGEPAGELLSNYLIAERALFYTSASFFKLAKTLPAFPDPEGELTFIEQFWEHPFAYKYQKTVSPILVYADLLNNPTPRNLETAEIIYNKYVRDTL